MSLLKMMANSDPIMRARLWIVLLALGLNDKTLEESVLDPLMTTDELARVLGCHPETVRRMTRDRTINGINVGGHWRYKWSQVEEDLKKWTDRRWRYYSDRRLEAYQAKQAKKRRRAAGLEDGEDSA